MSEDSSAYPIISRQRDQIHSTLKRVEKMIPVFQES